MQANLEFAECRRKHGDKAVRVTSLGQAISYRFKRDERGWRVFVTTKMGPVPAVTDRRRGAIGVDLNADHLAVAETDASGNYLRAWRVPLVTYGRSSHQAEALIGDSVAGVVEHARQAGKPVVIERLDFKQKKAQLEGESRRYSRMLSSFSYGKIKAYFISRGHRNGVEVFQVNPAYSSVIGRVKFMERYGLTVHQAAALVLARRLLSEHPPPADLSRWQRRPGRLQRTCKEAGEARMDALGRDPGAVETGACSAAPAGWSPSGPGCPGGLFLRGGLNVGPFGVPGRDSRAEPPCTVGAARPPARERVREWLLPVMTILTTVEEPLQKEPYRCPREFRSIACPTVQVLWPKAKIVRRHVLLLHREATACVHRLREDLTATTVCFAASGMHTPDRSRESSARR